ncbi:MAG: STAS domain-containing protein [Methanoregula sp.]|jgi:anti-sigma B factor antagonist|uniref:STAS domain-containing protein n=1 Tax=Methanoregula sp. TaxID=2052170 RepID=UPI003C27FAF5
MALCTLREKGNCLIVTLPVSVDHVEAMTLEKELREYVARQPKALLCDMSGTKYVSSSGLRVFLAIGKMAKTSMVHFGIFSLTKFVDHIFSMTGFTQVIAIYDTEEAAVRAVSKW